MTPVIQSHMLLFFPMHFAAGGERQDGVPSPRTLPHIHLAVESQFVTGNGTTLST